jgi:hypothetical protein
VGVLEGRFDGRVSGLIGWWIGVRVDKRELLYKPSLRLDSSKGLWKNLSDS